ncbi:putative phosphatidylglycerophosphatase [Helianthus annuus]|nr:putative phosphatidylglycerophosphatase [Helianthus annuus]
MSYSLSPPHHISHCCFHTHPIILHSSHRHHHRLRHRPSNPRIRSSHSSTGIFYSLPAIDEHQNHQNQHHDINDSEFFNRFYNSSSVNLNNPPRECEIEQDRDRDRGESSSGIFTNMWWADLKAAVGQRINVKGILFTVSVITRHRNWMIPHVWVPDVRYIDWAALKRKGFEGVVFDKDNTLTVPYSLGLWGPLTASVESCKSVFGNNVAVFSNSAGLEEYDPDGRKARAVEFAIGIRVIRHKMKKPGGSTEEIERHFGCDSSKLIMVGDRPFTDIVYGNRNGFLTILTSPLSLTEETFIVKQVRKIELVLLNWWLRKGLKPANPRLLPDALDCVKEPPPV